MTRVQRGEHIRELNLPNIDGTSFSIEQVQGKRYLLSFFRFASCPFCNLRVHQLVQQFPNFGDDFTVVGVFDASLDELQRSSDKQQSPFPILADEDNIYYRRFAVERSYFGVLKGMVLRFPQLCYSMIVKGNVPLRIGGHVATMPLNILVDEQGVIQHVHYGRDEGDHLSLESVKRFALTGAVPALG